MSDRLVAGVEPLTVKDESRVLRRLQLVLGLEHGAEVDDMDVASQVFVHRRVSPERRSKWY